MDEKLKSMTDALAKSSRNVAAAKNAAQREAAERFLVDRSQALEDEQARLAKWLHDADTYINRNMPEINSDASNEYNQEWLENLQDYQDISKALSSAWDAFMNAREAA